MNKLDANTRSQILHSLCEGQSILAITRLTGVSKNTVAKLLSDAGAICAEYQHQTLRNLTCKLVQVDEIWSFTYAKQKNVKMAVAAPEGAGDIWTWAAIDAETKLVMSWLVGGRHSGYALAFMDDVKSRLLNRVQLNFDGHKAYLEFVEGAFDGDIDYGMVVKIYGPDPYAEKRYSPAQCFGARRDEIEGDPVKKHISTSYPERQNLTTRIHVRRFTRLINGFSKKVEQHANAVALHLMYYNFVRIHQKLRVTPAMAAGVTGKLWEVSDIIALIEAKEAERPIVRGSYKKHAGQI